MTPTTLTDAVRFLMLRFGTPMVLLYDHKEEIPLWDIIRDVVDDGYDASSAKFGIKMSSREFDTWKRWARDWTGTAVGTERVYKGKPTVESAPPSAKHGECMESYGNIKPYSDAAIRAKRL